MPEKSQLFWYEGSSRPMARMMSWRRKAASRAGSCSCCMNTKGLAAYTLASLYPSVMWVMSYIPLIPMRRFTASG